MDGQTIRRFRPDSDGMSVSLVKTRNMAASSKTHDPKQPLQSGHNSMERYLKKTVPSDDHATKQRTLSPPVKETPKRKGKPHKKRSSTTTKRSNKNVSDQTETEPETEDNVSEREVFDESEQEEDITTLENRYNTLAELENEVVEEIDPRSVNLTHETQPLVLLALLRKVEILEQKHEILAEENYELKKTLEFNSGKILDLETEVSNHKIAIEVTQRKLDNVYMSNSRLKEQGTKLKEKTVKAEAYSRRNNLRFEGIPQESNENPNVCREKVYSILKNEFGMLDAERRIVIERCHRDKRYPNHNPPSILVRFLSFCDREEIWNRRDNVNRNQRNKIYLNQDFPPEVEKKRSFLRPYVKAAYAVGRKAVLVGDTIMVDGNKYTTSELENLPENMHPDKIAIQEKDDTILFYRSDAYLSNFYNAPMCVDDVMYQSVEQYFTAEKARTFKDQNTLNRIMESDSPSEMKFLGKKTKGFCQNTWDEKAATVMITGLRAKFRQNSRLQTKLLNTQDKHLAESSKNDRIWGTGLNMNDQNAFSKENWQGKNQLGNLLMKVREEIKRNNY